MAAKSSRRSGSSGRDDLRWKVQSGLFGDRETGRAIDELELTDDAAGPRHCDVHDIWRTDRADHPRTAERPAIDRDGVVRGSGEVALRTDTHVVHRNRLGAGVAELIDEVRQRALVEPSIDADRDPRTCDRALRAEHAQLRDLALGFGERAATARDRVLRIGDIATHIEDLVSELVVRLREIRDEGRER